MDAGLFSKLLKKHHNYRKEKKFEEGNSSISNFYHPREIPKFPVRFKDDNYIKKISHLNKSPIINGNEATFLYWGNPKRHVEFVSELSFWASNRNNTFRKVANENLYHITLELPEDARLEYKYVVDGNWVLDPLNKLMCDNGIGSYNSYVIMPNYKKVDTLFQREGIKQGKLEEFELIGKSIEGNRMVYVYLPPDYNETTMEYPTIYFHDGGDYINRAGAVNTINNLIADNLIRPIIAVFINPINRVEEYMYNIKYSKLVAQEVVPRIDENFRTIKKPDYRTIMGASLGGIISFFTAYNFPAVFKNISGQSSSFLYLEKDITRMIDNSHKEFNVYMDVGMFESLIYSNRRISQIYKRKGFKFFYQEINEGHTWSNWGTHLKDALIFFYGVSD
ncbi:MAG: alpha/beta hydrolase-fold protein [Candidatus Sericytochromatia bacterium]